MGSLTTVMGDEFLKLRTVRTPWVLLAVAQVLIVGGIAGLIVSGKDVEDVATSSQAMGHVGLVSFITLVLGIMAVAGEYRHKTITDTYLTTPHRGVVLGSKLIAYTLVGILFGVLSGIVAIVTTSIWLAVEGSSLALTNSEVLRTLIGGIGWDAGFAAIGVGLGALIRNLAGAIAVALAWIAIVEGIVGSLIGKLGDYLPFNSGVALDRMDPKAAGISQGTAAGLMVAYAVVFTLLALVFTTRRDVS
jgi:ABC-2 type transport system permease protein